MRDETGSYDSAELVAPGAFAPSVGRTVPVRGPSGRIVGHATVIDDDGRVEIQLTGGLRADRFELDSP